MIAIPTLDIRDGSCVQLAAGSYDRELFRIPDAVGVASAWCRYGFRYLNLVDIDAMTGRGTNTELVRTILSQRAAEVQVGGGIKTREAIHQLLNEDASRVVIGDRALEEPEWLAEMTTLFPGSVMVAAEVRDRKVLARGWARARPILALDLVDELNRLPLAGLVLNLSQHEDITTTPQLALLEDAVEAAEFPIVASGPFASINDLRAVADRGVAAAIIGVALYSGILDPRLVAEEFAE